MKICCKGKIKLLSESDNDFGKDYRGCIKRVFTEGDLSTLYSKGVLVRST